MTDPTELQKLLGAAEAREFLATEHVKAGETGWAFCLRDPTFRTDNVDTQIRAVQAAYAAGFARLTAERAEARRLALEEAATIAEDRAPAVQCMSVEPIVEACFDIANAIRARALVRDGGGNA